MTVNRAVKIVPENPNGTSVVLSRRRERLFAQTADTPMVALARAAVRWSDSVAAVG